MRVFGTVKDAKEEKPIKGAKISLSIAEKELAVLYTDSKGKFETSISGSYIDEVLICKVEKKGYKPQRISYDIEEDEVEVEIELLSIELELSFYVKDEKANPMKGVQITLKLRERQLSVGVTDKSGCFKTSLDTSLKGKKIDYYAELAGYEITKGSVKLKEEISREIIMKKAAQKFNWLPVILGFIGGGLGGFLFVLLEDSRVLGSNDLIIILFMGVFYGLSVGLGLGIGLRQNIKKILRLILSGIVGFLAGAIVVSPLMLAEVGGVGILIVFAVWIGIVGLSFSVGLKDEKVTLRLIKECLTKDIKATLRLIIAGLIAGFIAGFLSFILVDDVMLFAVFLISGLSFGIALGLPKSSLWKKWILIVVGIIVSIMIIVVVVKHKESRKIPVKEFPRGIRERKPLEDLQPLQPHNPG
jgi:hypothetical protein